MSKIETQTNIEIQNRETISKPQEILMLGTALFFDLMQASTKIFWAIPIIGWVIAPLLGYIFLFFAKMTFWLWFKMSLTQGGASTKVASKMLTKRIILYSSNILEFIPIINALPGITIGVFVRIQMEKHGDNKYNEKIIKAVNSI